VIRFVAEVRSKLGAQRDIIDPDVAETLIRHALGEAVTGAAETAAKVRAQVLLLIAMVGDGRLDDAGVDSLLSRARSLAERSNDPPGDRPMPAGSGLMNDSPFRSETPPKPTRAVSRAAAQRQEPDS
jgi:hypothetical protein